MPLTDLDIANMACRILGDERVANITMPSTRLEKLVADYFESIREDTLGLHHWNEVMKRVTLYAYREPAFTLTPGALSGTGITFTASGAAFVAADVGREIREISHAGRATIVSVDPGLAIATADITVDFSTVAAIASGDWQVWNATPGFGYAYQIELPSDCIRPWLVWDANEDELPFKQEGTVIVCDSEQANIEYVALITNPALYSRKLALVMSSRLAVKMAENMTGQTGKLQMAQTIFERELASAMALDNLVGTSPVDSSGGLMSEDR